MAFVEHANPVDGAERLSRAGLDDDERRTGGSRADVPVRPSAERVPAAPVGVASEAPLRLEAQQDFVHAPPAGVDLVHVLLRRTQIELLGLGGVFGAVLTRGHQLHVQGVRELADDSRGCSAHQDHPTLRRDFLHYRLGNSHQARLVFGKRRGTQLGNRQLLR